MGQPKGNLHVNGIPLPEHVWRQANWPGPTLLVTAPNRERPPGAEVDAGPGSDVHFLAPGRIAEGLARL